MSEYMRSMKGLVDAVDHVGKDFISITDMSTDQLYSLFELGKNLELFNRSRVDLLGDRMLALMFFQPSTRTRMSFQTAMERLGGHVIVEANPKVTSSVAKEESIEDTMRCVSQYANLMVIRHYDAAAPGPPSARSSTAAGATGSTRPRPCSTCTPCGAASGGSRASTSPSSPPT